MTKLNCARVGVLIAAILAFGCLFSTAAYAMHPKPEPLKPAQPVATADSVAIAGAKSVSAANATAGANATGGAANAQGGASNAIAAGGDGGQAASSADNAINFNTKVERSAPSLGQGGLMVSDCGAGGNAGGSNRTGAGFLGFVWTPEDCKLLMAAQAFQALGMVDTACDMLNGISVVKKRLRDLKQDAPPCVLKKPDAPKPDTALADSVRRIENQLRSYATKEELNRAFKRGNSK